MNKLREKPSTISCSSLVPASAVPDIINTSNFIGRTRPNDMQCTCDRLNRDRYVVDRA